MKAIHEGELTPSSDMEGQDLPSESTLLSIGFNHIDVYVAADKFGIRSLKAYASGRTDSWAKSHWDTGVFFDAVQHVLNSLPPHNQELAHIMSSVIASKLAKLVEKPGLWPLLEKFGSLGVFVISQLQRQCLIKAPGDDLRHSQKVSGLEETIARNQEAIHHSKQKLAQKEREVAEKQAELSEKQQHIDLLEQHVNGIRTVSTKLDNNERYRGCFKYLNVEFQDEEWAYGTFHCTNCDAKF